MKKKSILIIEDNEMNMKLFHALLKVHEFNVLLAPDAETGLKTLEKNIPDLVLMDIQLPGMDGYTATRIIKSNPRLKDIPVVALTSYAMHGDEAKAQEAGCDGYLTKPIDTKTFVDQIRRFLGEEKSEKRPKKAKRGQHKNRILIVDDEVRNLKLMKAMLPEEIYACSLASSGEEALVKIREELPDVVLLDIMMPEMDGLEVTQRIKQDPQIKNIPIILVTALEGPENRANGLEVGAEEYLTKPVKSLELQARISSMLQLKRYRDQLSIRSHCEQAFAESMTQEKKPKKPGRRDSVVLLVEDNEKDVRLVQEFLRGFPLQLEAVTTGKDALARILGGRVDMVLLDILLPDMSGFEVCENIKKMEIGKDMPIIGITCLDDLESKLRGIELGLDDFLVKPINQRELRSRIEVLLEKKEQIDKLRTHYETALSSAIIDWLTGLYNHGYFKKFLSLELKRSMRQNYPVGLLMIDVDDFKTCNDTLGHSAGDVLLRDLGQIIRSTVREVDLAARYGGDEFTVVLPYTGKAGASKVARRIQQAVCGHKFSKKLPESQEDITFSIGAAVFPDDADDADNLIRIADRMLYEAKQEGKNQVRIYDFSKGTADAPSLWEQAP